MDKSGKQTWTEDRKIDLLLAISAFFLLLWAIVKLKSFVHSSNDDTREYFLPWLDHILRYGRVASLEASYANYSPPYLYLLCIASLLHGVVSDPVLIRLPTLPFALLAGYMVYDISRFLGASPLRARLGGCLTLLLPDVVRDGLQWAQCDIIHTSLLLVVFRLLLARKSFAAMGTLGLALGIKLQAIFIGPVILGLLLAGEIPWLSVLLVPVGYLLSLVPAYLAGRPAKDLVLVYGKQYGTYTRLSMNAPNLYVFLLHVAKQFSEKTVGYISNVGLLITAVFTALLVFFVVRYGRLTSPVRLAALFAFSLALEPYLLPRMHDRYFFAGEIFLFLAALEVPRLWLAAILMQIAAAMTYSCFLDGVSASTAYLGSAALIMSWALFSMLRYLQTETSQGNLQVPA